MKNKNISKIEKSEVKEVVTNVVVNAAKLFIEDKTAHKESNKLNKALNVVTNEFKNVRAKILTLIAENAEIKAKFDKNAIILLLRQTKRTEPENFEKFITVQRISSFDYSATFKESVLGEVKKSFTQKYVLEACEDFLRLTSIQKSPAFIASLEFEQTLNAVNKVKKSVTSLQTELNFIVNDVEYYSTLIAKNENDLVAVGKLKESNEKLESKQKQLTNKTMLLDYISIASNRLLIK